MNETNKKSAVRGVAFFKEEEFHEKLQYACWVDGTKLVVNDKQVVKPAKSGFYAYEFAFAVGTTSFVNLLGEDEGCIEEAWIPSRVELKFRFEHGRVVSEMEVYGVKCVVLPFAGSHIPNDWCTTWSVRPVTTGCRWGVPCVYVDVMSEIISVAAFRRREHKVANGKRKPATHDVIVREAHGTTTQEAVAA